MTSLRVLIGIGLLASIAACSSSSGAIDDTDGAAVARELGCTSCHVETDTDVAPTLVGLSPTPRGERQGEGGRCNARQM